MFKYVFYPYTEAETPQRNLCRVLKEADWDEPYIWNEKAAPQIIRSAAYMSNAALESGAAYETIERPRPRVRIACDPWNVAERRFYSAIGKPLYISPSTNQWLDEDFKWMRPHLTIADVVTRICGIIDTCEHLDFFWSTQNPRLAGRTLPTDRKANCNCLIPSLEGSGTHSPGCSLFRPRANLFFGATVRTQADANKLVPELLATPAAGRWLSIVPEEPIQLRTGIYAMADDTYSGTTLDVWRAGARINRVQLVMSSPFSQAIKDQCDAAGVAVHPYDN